MRLEDLGNHTIIKTGSLDANAEVHGGKYPFFTCSKEPKQINHFAFDGEFVVVAGNGDLNVKYFNGKFNAYQRTYAISPKETVHGKYLYYFLEKYIVKLRELSIGGVIKYIKIGNLTEAKIPLPSLPQQQKIANILDAADALRQNAKALIAKYDELTQALFMDMFGDPVSNPKGWEKVMLGDISKISSGSTPSRENDSYYVGEIPWVKTGEVNGKVIYDTLEKISEEALTNSSCKLYPKGSLIIAMYGQGKTRGQIGMLGIDATTNQACGVIPPSEKMNFNFLFELLQLNYEDLRSLGRGGNQPNLNSALLKSYEVINPPLVLQNQFAERVAIIEEQKAIAQKSLEQSESLFNSLLQKAFKGELV
jgi:type I restriction enzyme S subunit